MNKINSVITAAAILFVGSFTAIQAESHNHVIQAPQETQWGPAPPMLPAGAQFAVLFGDPTKEGDYALRLKFPPNYAIPAHSHPTDEHVVVLSGALTFGMGEKLNKGAAANKRFETGGFALMPANMNHFAYTSAQETTVVLYGMGPVEFRYVNPADDPRSARTATK